MAQTFNPKTPGKRRGKRQPSLGHNLRLSDEERKALFLAHLHELRRQDENVNDAKELAKPALASIKAAATARRKARDSAADDGFNVNNLDRYLAELKRSPASLQTEANQVRLERTWAGLPQGIPRHPMDEDGSRQLEMNALRDYRAEGKRAGLMGEQALAPDGVVGEDLQRWMDGWGDGQSEIAWALSERPRIDKLRQFEGNDAKEAMQPANDNEPQAAE